MKYIEIVNKDTNEIVYCKKLNNGLEVYYMPKKGYTKKLAVFASRFGSNDLHFQTSSNEHYVVPEGIAHFLEHKMFEEEDGNVFDKFAPLGANVNAYTNFKTTAYYFTATDHFYQSLKILIDFVQNPYFTDENVEKEKGIITQEIKMYQDNPQWKVFFNFLKGMYHQHPVRSDIAGTIESINSITKEDLLLCFNTFYHASNMALFIAGDLDVEEVFHEVEDIFNNKVEIKRPLLVRHYPHEPAYIKSPLVEEDMMVSNPLFYLGYKEQPKKLDHFHKLKHEAATRILLDLLFGKSSEMYEILYEEGLIDESFGVDYVTEEDYGHSLISGKSNNPNEVRDIINNRILEVKKMGIDKSDFMRVKRKHIGENISYYDSMEYIANSFITYKFKGLNFFDYGYALKEVSIEETNEVLIQHFSEDLQVLSIVKPNN